MPFIPYHTANDVADLFLELLRRRNINPPQGGAAEGELLALTDLLEIWRNPNSIRNTHNEAQTIRSAAAIHDLAAKVLSAQALPDFASFEAHLALIAQAKEFTTIGQIGPADGRDDISRKIAELYSGCLAVHCGKQIVLDHPVHAAGDNPDILLTYNDRKWALAVKTLVSSRNGQTIFERIREGAAQIDRSGADCGMVLINAKNVIGHDAFWGPPPPFVDLDGAVEALRTQLRGLVDLAAQNRPQVEWDDLFLGKTVPPVILIGQSVTYLPIDGGFQAPTPVKAMVTDACNRVADPAGVQLACCLNHWMQTIILGQPGPPPA